MSLVPDTPTTPPVPPLLDAALLQRMRDNLAQLERRDQIVRANGFERKKHFIATGPSGKAIYDRAAEDIPTRESIHQEFAHAARAFASDLKVLRNWLETRAIAHAHTVATRRRDLAKRLVAHYADDAVLASLVAAASRMLCYRVGLPLLLPEELRGPWMPQPDLWDVTTLARLKARIASVLPAVKYEYRKDPNGGVQTVIVPPDFQLHWRAWSGDKSHNHSPFPDRFAAMDTVFGSVNWQDAQIATYATHPTLMALSLQIKPLDLAAIVIMPDITMRNAILRARINAIADDIMQSADTLIADVSVSNPTVFSIGPLGLSIQSDYVDWGNHLPLLLAAVSELGLQTGDPLKSYTIMVLLPDMDVMSWRETVDSVMLVIGIAATVLTLGGASGILAGVVMLELSGAMLAASGLVSASAQIYEGAVAEDRMAVEHLLGQFPQDLAGYENHQVAAEGVFSLAMELMTLGLFPPTLRDTKSLVRSWAKPAVIKAFPKTGQQLFATPGAGGLGVADDAGGAVSLPKYLPGSNAAIDSVGYKIPFGDRATTGLTGADAMANQRASGKAQSAAAPQARGTRTSFADPQKQHIDPGAQDLGTHYPVHVKGSSVPPPQSNPTTPLVDPKAIPLATRATNALARGTGMTSGNPPDPQIDDDDQCKDIPRTFDFSAAGTVLAQRKNVTRISQTYKTNYLAHLSVEDSGSRFGGRRAYTLVYELRALPAFHPAEMAKIRERIALMNSYVAQMVEDTCFPIRIKRLTDPHVKTAAKRLVTTQMKNNRKSGNRAAGDDVDVDEVWARNLFEVPLDIITGRPELEAELQIELPRWINGFFGQFDTVLRDLILQHSPDGYDTLVLDARVTFI